MHLHTILAFALLFWLAGEPHPWCLFPENDILWTLLVVLLQPLLLAAGAGLTAHRTARLLAKQPEALLAGQQFYHRAMSLLRLTTLLGFAAAALFTRWPQWFAFGTTTPALQILGDLIVLSPYFAGAIAVWLAVYPVERMLRGQTVEWAAKRTQTDPHPWPLRSYLDFNIRHHLLVVAVPMTIILMGANLTRGYEAALVGLTGRVWAPDVLLGVLALGVFLLAPLMLTRIWRTTPLDPGPVRRRLLAICDRIGLGCREILVWHSDGMMINAAVMGLWPRVRYVLLSDALLETMTVRQIEAVFGHEVGHIRRHHIPYFLVFAYIGWLLATGAMELLARASTGPDASWVFSPVVIQSAGTVGAILFWGVGFGWLSRRFERQADLFGASCVVPDGAECSLPCSVHGDEGTRPVGAGRVCASGAAVFASALDRVAVLNGIPHEERSWRHSSVASRIRFLTSLAGDPTRAAGFERLVRRLKLALLSVAVIGSLVSLAYWTLVSELAILRS